MPQTASLSQGIPPLLLEPLEDETVPELPLEPPEIVVPLLLEPPEIVVPLLLEPPEIVVPLLLLVDVPLPTLVPVEEPDPVPALLLLVELVGGTQSPFRQAPDTQSVSPLHAEIPPENPWG